MKDENKAKTHKRKSYKNECEKLTKELQNLQDRFLRTVAEFDNFKKRTEKLSAECLKNANYNLLQKLLPVLDDLDRFVGIENTTDFNSLFDGIKLLRNNFFNILKQEGVQEMESIGKPFDHDLHEALIQIETKDVEPNTVVEEHAKGYLFNDRVLRYAKVIVSK